MGEGAASEGGRAVPHVGTSLGHRGGASRAARLSQGRRLPGIWSALGVLGAGGGGGAIPFLKTFFHFVKESYFLILPKMRLRQRDFRNEVAPGKTGTRTELLRGRRPPPNYNRGSYI